MSNKYSQIKKGLEYQTALDNYVEYLRNPANRRTKRLVGGTRGAQRQSRIACVLPFGIDQAGGEKYLTQVSEASWNALGAVIGARLSVTQADLALSSKVSKFKPARASVFRGSGAASYVQSKVTKLFYLKYTGDSYSIPFGAVSEGEEEQVGSRVVKAALITGGSGSDVNRVSISPERVPV